MDIRISAIHKNNKENYFEIAIPDSVAKQLTPKDMLFVDVDNTEALNDYLLGVHESDLGEFTDDDVMMLVLHLTGVSLISHRTVRQRWNTCLKKKKLFNIDIKGVAPHRMKVIHENYKEYESLKLLNFLEQTC